ncbi:hypothetical protein HanXRQr2_Chr12g0559071 [Helianthus annuus]|uniref:Uncharacterized protein n=1 Tax=Helianthus annuus TaxID=4232 RepID=A0A251T4L6_HELAN|nr:hypothetical protein HanXRQr2_Chr12g0559071 [Helianthus annuus]KAJ0864138.1 hypothetical protein HanPSC8_Chr12g0538251 [Helianthus annuus]
MKIAKTVAKKRTCTEMIHLRRDTFLRVQMKRVIIRTIIEIGVKSVDWVWDFAGLEP